MRVFRWFVAVRLGLLGLVAWAANKNPDPTDPQFPEVGILFFGVLMLMLTWPRVQRVMGRAFLPTALVLASLGPVAEGIASFEGRLDAGLSINRSLEYFWVPFVLLFVPLLLIAWQYRYRAVLLFAAGTSFLDLGSIIPLVEERTSLDVAALTAIVTARGLLYAFIGAFVVKLAAAQREARRSLTTHSTTLEHLATSRERNRLARELHDTLAHSLSGIAVQLEAVKTLWDDDSHKARNMLDNALADARGGLGEARRAIQTLRASPLVDLGLADAICQLGEAAANRCGMAVNVSVADKVGHVGPELENTIYRIADEALTNAARHSGAEKVSVDLRRKAGRVRLEVSDDGIGFDVGAAAPEGHVGISGMNERAAMVGGTLEITSDRELGTTVTFEVSPWK